METTPILRVARLGVGLAVLALAAGPVEAASPFGAVTGKFGGGNSATGNFALTGWALDDDGVAAVDVLVDGAVVGRASYHRARPLITKRHPGFPDSSAPGWVYSLDTTRFLNGKHQVSARVHSLNGERIDLPAKTFFIGNAVTNLVPFGEIEFPNRNVEWVGNCTLSDPNRRYQVVSGWALDSGIQQADRGVAYVELLIDRALRYNSKKHCTDEPAKGGLSNCYGLRRLDVEGVYPTLPDSPAAGFRFVLDIGQFLASGLYSPGHHTVTIRVTDVFDQIKNVAEIPVFFRCDEPIFNEGSKGFIDAPPPGLVHSGSLTLSGWAVDWEGVGAVLIHVDGSFVGNALVGLPRGEVTLAYPGYPDSAAPGWQFTLDTTALADGFHTVQAVVSDDLGATTLVGERTIQVLNP